MEKKSKEEIVEDVASSLLDLEDEELVDIANKFLQREVVYEDGVFVVGASDFQPIKKKYNRSEGQEELILDGKKLKDGDRIIVLYPDNTECDAVLESSDVSSYSNKDRFHFLDSHHGVPVRIELREGMRAKWES